MSNSEFYWIRPCPLTPTRPLTPNYIFFLSSSLSPLSNHSCSRSRLVATPTFIFCLDTIHPSCRRPLSLHFRSCFRPVTALTLLLPRFCSHLRYLPSRSNLCVWWFIKWNKSCLWKRKEERRWRRIWTVNMYFGIILIFFGRTIITFWKQY